MCDYSLHAFENRLAEQGETLVATRFPGGSMGFVSEGTVRTWDPGQAASSPVAVCLPPGAKLSLERIPTRLQEELGVREHEEVTFTQLSCRSWEYRDAVRFENGKEVLVQRLAEGQVARVLHLGADVQEEEKAVEKAREPETRRFSFAALLHQFD